MIVHCACCGEVLGRSDTCLEVEPFVIKRPDAPAAVYRRIPFGDEVLPPDPRHRRLPARCHDCGVVPGGIHHGDCCVQQCPACLGQLMGCMCIYEGDEDWDPAWALNGAAAGGRWLDEPVPGEDPGHPCPKCGAVPLAPGDGSGRWCRTCHWSWMIGFPGGYVMEPSS